MQRQAMDSRPYLSVVTTLYKSAEFIREFHCRITASLQELTKNYELVFVNDGSPDDSLQIALSLSYLDPRIKVVDLSRNFGHHSAIVAGLRQSLGDFVFLIDVDLEERPEWLLDFWNNIQAGNADVVYGVQTARSGSHFKRHTGSLFYRLFNAASDTQIPVNQCTVRLMKRRYVEAVVGFTESHLFLAGLFSWVGFTQCPVYVTKTRRDSASTYSLPKLMSLFVNAITSFSAYPLKIVFVAGLCITVLSLLYACVLIVSKLARPQFVLSGFTSLMVSLWFLGGTIISTLGVVGMYVGRLFAEAKNRPQYLIRQVYSGATPTPSGLDDTSYDGSSHLSHESSS